MFSKKIIDSDRSIQYTVLVPQKRMAQEMFKVFYGLYKLGHKPIVRLFAKYFRDQMTLLPRPIPVIYLNPHLPRFYSPIKSIAQSLSRQLVELSIRYPETQYPQFYSAENSITARQKRVQGNIFFQRKSDIDLINQKEVLIIDDLFSSGTVLREMYKVVSQTSPAQIHTLVLAKIPQGQPYATESEIENYVLEKTDSQILKKLINRQNISYTRRFFDAVISTRFGLYEELLISLEKNNPEILEQLAQYLVYRGLGVPVRKNDMLFSVLNKLYPHSERPAYFYPLVLQ